MKAAPEAQLSFSLKAEAFDIKVTVNLPEAD